MSLPGYTVSKNKVVSTTFADAQITREPINGYISVTLPSGKVFPNIKGWGPRQYNDLLDNPEILSREDRQALNSIQFSIDNITQNFDQALTDYQNENPVNESASVAIYNDKYENSTLASVTTSEQSTVDDASEFDYQTADQSSQTTNEYGRTLPFPAGAMPNTPPPASVTFKNIAGEQQPQDMRVKIRVPRDYLTILTKGPGNKTGVLGDFGGIVFPYTPQISFEHKADYAAQNPLHSNFTQYFYQRSSISPINVSGKFTVSNEDDAITYVATIHLLRALVKMRSGGPTGDKDSGAPPPICRLDAYGTFMLQNVPVVISSFKLDLPDNIDYYTLGKKTGTVANTLYEKTAIPIISTISVTCLPIYSRDEIQKFNVTQWLNEKYVRKAGFL